MTSVVGEKADLADNCGGEKGCTPGARKQHSRMHDCEHVSLNVEIVCTLDTLNVA